MSIGPWQVLLVLGLVLLVFGPSKIPGLGKSLGQAIRGFKKGISEDEIDVTDKTKINSDDKENKDKKDEQ